MKMIIITLPARKGSRAQKLRACHLRNKQVRRKSNYLAALSLNRSSKADNWIWPAFAGLRRTTDFVLLGRPLWLAAPTRKPQAPARRDRKTMRAADKH